MLNVLVYGWYGSGIKNIGDLLFCKSFEHLFPDFNFTYTNVFRTEEILQSDAIIIGGGSFLYAPINIGKSESIENIINVLKSKNVFYIGVGIETDIHPIHQEIIRSAKLVATRTRGGVEKVATFADTHTIEINDIVCSLAGKFKANEPKSKSVLVLPNAELLPRWNDVHWKHSSWDYFKTEFAQFLDSLKEAGYKISFGAMCRNDNMHDLGAASEIINYMKYRNFHSQITLSENVDELAEVIGQYDVVISQRYHGVILAEICQRKCISIAHHDKLKNVNKSSVTIPYYSLSKDALFKAFDDIKKSEILPIKLDTFETLRNCVYSTIGIKCPNTSV
jgi:polysaccharide pyruvyl transferase WcaK-like protein